MNRLSLILMTVLVAATVPTHALKDNKDIAVSLGFLGMGTLSGGLTFAICYRTYCESQARATRLHTDHNEAGKMVQKLIDEKKLKVPKDKEVAQFINSTIWDCCHNSTSYNAQTLNNNLDNKLKQRLHKSYNYRHSPDYTPVIPGTLAFICFALGTAGLLSE